MNFFAKFHPTVMLLYFLGAMGMVLLYFDPLLFVILFLSQWIFYSYCKGIVSALKMVGRAMILMLIIVAINGLVNQRGMILIGQWGEHKIMAESLIYGSMMALLLVGTLFLFGCYQIMMSSTQIMYLFGKHFPNVALIFSMMLRFVPTLAHHFKELRKNHSNQMGVISTLVGMSMEEAMITGRAMEQKGYGHTEKRRTSIFCKRVERKDVFLTSILLFLLGLSIGIYASSGTRFLTFPYLEYLRNGYSVVAYCCYGIYCFLPMFINGIQEVRFYCLRTKI